jgi:hypothetical protein
MDVLVVGVCGNLAVMPGGTAGGMVIVLWGDGEVLEECGRRLERVLKERRELLKERRRSVEGTSKKRRGVSNECRRTVEEVSKVRRRSVKDC